MKLKLRTAVGLERALMARDRLALVDTPGPQRVGPVAHQVRRVLRRDPRLRRRAREIGERWLERKRVDERGRVDNEPAARPHNALDLDAPELRDAARDRDLAHELAE